MSIARTIFKNTFFNWTGMFVTTIVMVLLTPYLLKNLGAERYGIYQVIVPITQYLIFLELGLRGGIARFCSIYIADKDSESLNKVLNSTLSVGLFIAILTFVFCWVVGNWAPSFFNISDEYHQQVVCVFIALGASISFSFLGYSFGGILTGYQRYGLLNLALVIGQISKALLIVIFFQFGWVSLTSWALAISLSAILTLVFPAFFAFKIQKTLALNIRYVDFRVIKDIVGFSAWNMLLQLCAFFALRMNPVIIGKYMGVSFVPLYAIPLMLVTRLQAGVAGLSATLLPIASSTISSGDKGLVRKLLFNGTSITALLTFGLGGVLLVMCKNLFQVWLPDGYEDSWIVYAVLMIAFFGSIPQTTSYYILLGSGDIRPVAIVYFSASLITLMSSIYIVGHTDMGILGAAWAVVIPRILSFCIFMPWYICKHAEASLPKYYIDGYFKPLLKCLPSIIIAMILQRYFWAQSLLSWVIIYGIALIPTMLIFGYTKRKMLIHQLISK